MVVEAQRRDINQWLPQETSGAGLMEMANPSGVEEKGYYGIPMLKRPLWGWEIALYFFFEGISAGAYLLGTMADLFAEDRYTELTRTAHYISLIALLPCPPLLIADLGRPERFHHMLRVFKPSSPMNTGAWALMGYSLPVGLLAVKQLAGDVSSAPDVLKRAGALMPQRGIGALGIPFALTMVSYPGVLLSTTSTPVWSRTRFLGALIASSSISTGAAALSLVLALRGGRHSKAIGQLEKIETAAKILETATLAAYLTKAGEAAAPLTTGRYAKLFWAGAVGAGLIAPTLVRASSPKGSKRSRLSLVLGSSLSLAGSLALKWAVTYAGRASAEDPSAARDATRPSKDAPGWNAGDAA